MKIILVAQPAKTDALVLLGNKKTDWKKIKAIHRNDQAILQSNIKNNIKNFILQSGRVPVIVSIIDAKENTNQTNETIRKAGQTVNGLAIRHKIRTVAVANESKSTGASFYFAEGLALSNYQFIKYRKDEKKEQHSLREIKIMQSDCSKPEIIKLQSIVDAVYMVRDWVNEPVNHLNATQLAETVKTMGEPLGIKTTIFNKKKISELNMGGLLAVNQGSVDPPTFSIMEYKPGNATNDHPVVLVGKGVVYDTGGLSLKPTGGSMDYMKCDMAGAATIAGAIYIAAKTQLPLHIIGLIPSTDNRPGGNAFAPGDIIRMFDGTTVEMLNSDAEGRMILADALAWAKQYKPKLVMDVATLTGAAHRALGDHAIAYMGTADASYKSLLEESGLETYERLVGFPLWEEYGDMLKSDIADMKNIGGALAGQITAGKFLERFTDYPWLHLDIAGMAYFHSSMGYKGKNASAVGVRLIYRFLEKLTTQISK